MLIKTINLVKNFNADEVETMALDRVNITINEKEFISIMGPSGCGKSTLLNIIGMLDNPTFGELYINGKATSKLNENQRTRLRKSNIGFIFQSFNLIDELTVYDNVELPLLYQKISASERKKTTLEILEKMKILHRRNYFPQQLSGGQQQRVAIARAIITHPAIILADEPTGNLDSASGEEIMNTLFQLNEEGTTIVMATHSQNQAEKTHRIIHLFDGHIITENIQKTIDQ